MSSILLSRKRRRISEWIPIDKITDFTTDRFLSFFKQCQSSSNSDNNDTIIVELIASVGIFIQDAIESKRISLEDVVAIVCNEQTVAFFDIDTFWIFHLHEILEFSNYIEYLAVNNILERLENYLYESIMTAIETKNETKEENMMVYFACDIVKYLYQKCESIFDLHSNNISSSSSISYSSTIPIPINITILHLLQKLIIRPSLHLDMESIPHPIKHFSNIDLNYMRDILLLLQSSTSTTTFEYSSNKSTSSQNFLLTILKDILCYGITIQSNLYDQKQLFNSNFIEFLYCFDPQIIFSAIDFIVTNVDNTEFNQFSYIHRDQINHHQPHRFSDHSFNEFNCISISTTKISFVDQWIEANCFVYLLSEAKPTCFSQYDITELSSEYKFLSQLFLNNSQVDSTCHPNPCHLLELVTYLSNTCLHAIRQNNGILFQRILCFMDTLSSTFIRISKYLTITSLSNNSNKDNNHNREKSNNNIISSSNDSTNFYLCNWLNMILDKVTSKSEGIDDITLSKSIFLFSETKHPNNHSISLSNQSNIHQAWKESFEFICISLLECILYQSKSTLLGLIIFIKSKRSISRDYVDNYLFQVTTKLDNLSNIKQMSQIHGLYPNLMNPMEEIENENENGNTGKKKPRDGIIQESIKENIPPMISEDRILTWIHSYKTNNVISVGLNHACSTLGYKNVLLSMEKFLETNTNMIETCKAMITKMSLPPIQSCPVHAVQSFLLNITFKSINTMSVQNILNRMKDQLHIPTMIISKGFVNIISWFVEVTNISKQGKILSDRMQLDSIGILKHDLDDCVGYILGDDLLQKPLFYRDVHLNDRFNRNENLSKLNILLCKMIIKLYDNVSITYINYDQILSMESSSSNKNVKLSQFYLLVWNIFLQQLYQLILSNGLIQDTFIDMFMTRLCRSIENQNENQGENQVISSTALIVASLPFKDDVYERMEDFIMNKLFQMTFESQCTSILVYFLKILYCIEMALEIIILSLSHSTTDKNSDDVNQVSGNDGCDNNNDNSNNNKIQMIVMKCPDLCLLWCWLYSLSNDLGLVSPKERSSNRQSNKIHSYLESYSDSNMNFIHSINHTGGHIQIDTKYKNKVNIWNTIYLRVYSLSREREKDVIRCFPVPTNLNSILTIANSLDVITSTSPSKKM